MHHVQADGLSRETHTFLRAAEVDFAGGCMYALYAPCSRDACYGRYGMGIHRTFLSSSLEELYTISKENTTFREKLHQYTIYVWPDELSHGYTVNTEKRELYHNPNPNFSILTQLS